MSGALSTFSKVDVSKLEIDDDEAPASGGVGGDGLRQLDSAMDGGSHALHDMGLDDEIADQYRAYALDADDVGQTFDIVLHEAPGGRVPKTLLSAGSDDVENPIDGWDVEVSYTAWVCGIETPFENVEHAVITLGSSCSLPIGTQVGIKSMRESEKARFNVPPELGYGDAGDAGKGVPARSSLVYEVTLVNIIETVKLCDDHIVKRRLRKGTGWDRPREHAEVTAIWSGRLAASGTVFQPEREFTFTVGDPSLPSFMLPLFSKLQQPHALCVAPAHS